jgi:hypothetical protein
MKLTLPKHRTEKEAMTALRQQTSKFSDKLNKDGVLVPTDENGRQLRESGVTINGDGTYTPFLIVSHP